MRLLLIYLSVAFVIFESCSVSEQVVQDCMSLAQSKQFDQAKLCFEIRQSSLTDREQLAYAGTLAELNESDKAITILENLQSRNPENSIYSYYLGKIAEDEGLLSKAERNYSRFLKQESSNPNWKNRAETFIRNLSVLEQNQASDLAIDKLFKLPQTINTEGLEFGPSLTIDGKRMVFTRNVNGQEDLYYSQKDDEGNWVEAVLIEELYTPANEGAHCLSANGKVLIFTRCSGREGYGGCDLYWSQYDGVSWASPQNMGENINTEYWESQPAISANGEYLFFSSNRPNGHGSKDIWVSVYKENEGWGKAFNAGDQINTKGNDQAPFLHADQRTLYFASDYWPGHGGLDIFVTSNEGKSKWSEPKNLGPLINNDKDNYGFYVGWSGETAYFHEYEFTKDGRNLSDIFAFEMLPEFRPEPTSYLEVMVTDLKDRSDVVGAQIKLIDTRSGKTIYKTNTDKKGHALFALQSPSQQISIEVKKDGYIFYSDYFDLRELDEPAHAYVINVNLERLPVDGNEVEPVVLKNVFFESGESIVLPESLFELQELASLLKENPIFRIQISGHTDDIGNEQDNLRLSQDRAEAVKKQLIEFGIEEERIEAVGYGEAKPMAENTSEEGRLQNRRTEFLILIE